MRGSLMFLWSGFSVIPPSAPLPAGGGVLMEETLG